MKVLTRSLLALLFGFCLIVPTPATGGGGGSTGIWILPCFVSIPVDPWGIFRTPLSQARVHRKFENLSNGISMRLPEDAEEAIGTLYVPQTSTLFGVRVIDGDAHMSAAMFAEFFRAGITRAELLLVAGDDSYLPIVFVIDPEKEIVDAYVL